MKIAAAILAGSAIGIAGLVVILALTPAPATKVTYTYQDLAADEAARCITAKGYGKWESSMGIGLRQFCDAAGNVGALRQHRRDQPEKY